MSADKCPNCGGVGVSALAVFYPWTRCPACKGTGLATPNEKEGTTMYSTMHGEGTDTSEQITIRKFTEIEYEGREVTVEISVTYPDREENVARGVLEATFNETFHVLEDREARNVG